MHELVVKGKARVFGDNINTDIIIPAKYLLLPLSQLQEHVMEPIDPDFSRKAEKGDIIVAGKNFGCGSSREQAPLALKTLGISAVLAESYSRIFFRNAISIGLPVVQCKNLRNFAEEGDMLVVNLNQAQVNNCTTRQSVNTESFPKRILDILESGGLVGVVRKKFGTVF